MPIIKDILGNSYTIRKKYEKIQSHNFILTKKTPTGASTYFLNGYEATTGNWVANGKNKEEVISEIIRKMPIIKKKIDAITTKSDGLF